MTKRRLPLLALLVAVVGCDSETKGKVEALERRDEQLQEQQEEAEKAAKEERAKLEGELAVLRTSRDDLAAKYSGIDEEIADLRDRVEEAEAKLTDLQPAEKPVRPGRPDPALRYKVDVRDAQQRGPKDAKITVVVFSDFQCPFCKRVNPTLKEVEKRYGKDVRFVFMHNPLPMHNRALPAAIAAEAAGRQGKFFEMHDLLFESSRDLTDDNFIKFARQLKLDVAKFKKDLKDPAIERLIKKQQSSGQVVGARGTPSFFVNGRFLSGAQPLPSFERLIDEEVKEADSVLARGVGKSRLYDELMKSALQKV